MEKSLIIIFLVIFKAESAKLNCFSIDDAFESVIIPTFEDEMSEKGKFHETSKYGPFVYDIRGFVRFLDLKHSNAQLCSSENKTDRVVELEIDSVSSKLKIFVEGLQLKLFGKLTVYDGSLFVEVPSARFAKINATIVFNDKKCDMVFKYDRFQFDKPAVFAGWFVRNLWNVSYSLKVIRAIIDNKIDGLVSTTIIPAVTAQREAICAFLRS